MKRSNTTKNFAMAAVAALASGNRTRGQGPSQQRMQ